MRSQAGKGPAPAKPPGPTALGSWRQEQQEQGLRMWLGAGQRWAGRPEMASAAWLVWLGEGMPGPRSSIVVRRPAECRYLPD